MIHNLVVDDDLIDFVAEFYLNSVACKQAMTFYKCLAFFCNGFALEVIECISTSIVTQKAS